MTASRADGLFVMSSPLLNRGHARVIALPEKHRLPATYQWREQAEEGGLLAYGSSARDLPDAWQATLTGS